MRGLRSDGLLRSLAGPTIDAWPCPDCGYLVTDRIHLCRRPNPPTPRKRLDPDDPMHRDPTPETEEE